MVLESQLREGIPLGSGLCGSASSAVGAIVAANELLDNPLPRAELLIFAMEGEKAASGSYHADNVASSLYGGLTLCSNLKQFKNKSNFSSHLNLHM